MITKLKDGLFFSSLHIESTMLFSFCGLTMSATQLSVPLLDEVDARPIKKGKTHPSCEFGTTLQVSFNRDGFMITTENLIGQPGDKTLFLNTLEHYKDRMKGYAKNAVTDLGYRSLNNQNGITLCKRKSVNTTYISLNFMY